MQQMCGAKRRPMKAFRAGHIEISFVDGSHLDLWREAAENFVNPPGIVAVPFVMSFDENCMRTQFVCRPQRHRGVDAELARFIRCSRDHAALIRLPADNNRFPLQIRIEKLLDRDEESIHVDMENSLHLWPVSATQLSKNLRSPRGKTWRTHFACRVETHLDARRLAFSSPPLPANARNLSAR
jgi:hypothetical protein